MVRTPSSKRQSDRQANNPRALRIGVVLGDTFVEERVLRDPSVVTIGQSDGCTFVVPVDELPLQFELFVSRSDKLHLRFGKTMKGRVSVAGKPRSLASLRDREAKREGDMHVLPLEPNVRGKLELGELRLLFQAVTAPPLLPRPRLPASVRGSIADRIDPRLAIIVSLSLMVHFAIGLFAYNHDQVIERRGKRLQREFRANVYQPEAEPLELTSSSAEPGASASAASASTPTAKSASTSTQEPSPTSADEPSPTQAQVKEAIEKTALMNVLGSDGEEGRYKKGADIDQGAGLNASISDIRDSNRRVTTEDDARGVRDRVKKKLADRHGDPELTVQDAKPRGEKREMSLPEARPGPVTADDPEFLDPKVVIRKIKQRYLRGIKLCHQRGMKSDPTLGGRVQLRFVVGPNGKTTSTSARGFDTGVDACIRSQMNNWRFAAPKDDGEPASTGFSIPFMLKPGVR